jgi:YVTN family beta-propeller protein
MSTKVIGIVAVIALAGCSNTPSGTPSATSTPAAAPVAVGGPRVYVTNERSGNLTVIDVANRQAIATIPLGKRPRGIRLSPDGKTLYIALSGSPIAPPGVDEKTLPPPDRSADGIGVFDIATMKLARVIHAGTDPEQLAVSKDGSRLYVANEDAALASVVDVATGNILHKVEVGGEPEGVDIDPSGNVVYVTSEEDNEVFAIDAAKGTILAQFKTCARPRSTGFLPDGSKAYISCETANAVQVVDARAHKVVKTIKLPNDTLRPMGVVVTPDAGRVLVSTGRGRHVVIIDPKTDEVRSSIEVGERPWGIAVSSDGKTLYTANGPSNDVSIVDIESGTILARVAAGDSPWGVVYVP